MRPRKELPENLDRELARIKRAIRAVTLLGFEMYAVKSKRRDLADARKIFAHECRELGLTMRAIGGLLDLPASVVNRSLERYDDYYTTDPDFRRKARNVAGYRDGTKKRDKHKQESDEKEKNLQDRNDG